MTRFVVVGDVMVDVVARIDRPLAYASDTPAHTVVSAGGSAANTAAWLGWLGASVTFVGAVGDDVFGRLARAALEDAGVRTLLTVDRTRATGTCVVVVDPTGERTMLPDSGANGSLDAGVLGELGLSAADHLHLSGYSLLNPASAGAARAILEGARAAGASTSLDPASAAPLRAMPEPVRAALSLTDVLLANAEEAAVLTGEADPARACAALAARVSVAVVKQGAEGVIACRLPDDRLDVHRQPARRVDVVDTTGAGDAFAAGFLRAWRRSPDLAAAVAEGQDLAARAVVRVGARPSERHGENRG